MDNAAEQPLASTPATFSGTSYQWVMLDGVLSRLEAILASEGVDPVAAQRALQRVREECRPANTLMNVPVTVHVPLMDDDGYREMVEHARSEYGKGRNSQ